MRFSVRPTLIKAGICVALAGTCLSAQSTTIDPLRFQRVAVAAELQGMKLGVWERYSKNYILPDFGNRLGLQFEHDASERGSYEVLVSPLFAKLWEERDNNAKITIDFDYDSNSDLLLGNDPSARWFEVDRSGVKFDRTLFAPGLTQRIGANSSVDVGAVFARQSYATQGLGYSINDPSLARQSQVVQESSAGTGLRVAFNNRLTNAVELGAEYRSRIEMDAFQTFRGVYSEPGDFDIPASANFKLAVRTTLNSALNFGVERVLYSEVNTFTSAGLPDRFLSLLGDSGSPDFNWQDLTVYRLGWEWGSSDTLSWRVNYSTREQPIPTSPILANALDSEVADRSMSLGVSKHLFKQTGFDARFDFALSYAPSEYFLGTTNRGRQTDFADDQLEFEFRLVWDF